MLYEVLDDFPSKIDQERILGILGSENFPWCYNECTLYPSDQKTKNDKPQLVHSFCHNGEYEGDQNVFQFIKGVLPFPEWDTHHLHRCKFNLNLPLCNKKIITPHLDVPNGDGIVYLYYVNDSDGPTRIWPHVQNKTDWNDISIFDRRKYSPIKIHPKKGRVLRMTTKVWHTSDVPRNFNKRIVGNFVFLR